MKYKILTNIRHSDVNYIPGEVIELTCDEAARLLGLGVIEEEEKGQGQPAVKPFSKPLEETAPHSNNPEN